MSLDVSNRFLVAVTWNKKVMIMLPPVTASMAITPEDALVLAAWLVALSEHNASVKFSDVLESVQNA